MKVIREVSTEIAMVALGDSLARACKKAAVKRCIIYLSGELGAGKTTLARGFLRGFGYKLLVKSPTYTIVEPYVLDDHWVVYHFDLYRLTSAKELAYIGGSDYFSEEAICLIEWPDHGSGVLPEADLEITITMDRILVDQRTLIIESLSNTGCEVVSALHWSN